MAPRYPPPPVWPSRAGVPLRFLCPPGGLLCNRASRPCGIGPSAGYMRLPASGGGPATCHMGTSHLFQLCPPDIQQQKQKQRTDQAVGEGSWEMTRYGACWRGVKVLPQGHARPQTLDSIPEIRELLSLGLCLVSLWCFLGAGRWQDLGTWGARSCPHLHHLWFSPHPVLSSSRGSGDAGCQIQLGSSPTSLCATCQTEHTEPLTHPQAAFPPGTWKAPWVMWGDRASPVLAASSRALGWGTMKPFIHPPLSPLSPKLLPFTKP